MRSSGKNISRRDSYQLKDVGVHNQEGYKVTSLTGRNSIFTIKPNQTTQNGYFATGEDIFLSWRMLIIIKKILKIFCNRFSASDIPLSDLWIDRFFELGTVP